jgi:predicted acylesterase/phospholipase RssA
MEAVVSLPPAFDMTPIGKKSYWDGGLFDNTPLGAVLDHLNDAPDVDRTVYVAIGYVQSCLAGDRYLPRNTFGRPNLARLANRVMPRGKRVTTLRKIERR